MNVKAKTVFVLLFLAVLIGLRVHKDWQYKKTVQTLTSIHAVELREFKIYPRVTFGPSNNFSNFILSDSLVKDFFYALSDIRPYSPNHDTVASLDHAWFIELGTELVTLQIGFLIPSNPGERVVGYIAEGHKANPQFHGQIQSRQLYQWYQKYSHRWLEPEGAQPTPTPQPEPPGGE